ncbi:MAG: hypothetical protein FWB85_05215 [Chitinispirillia bacterium]|nr:hypothetical protein [Chitinispirillia bacterium]
MKSIYIIRNNVTFQCSPLFVAVTDNAAVREFSNMLSHDAIIPAELDLYRLGSLSASDESPDAPEIAACGTKHIINGAAVFQPIPEREPTKEALNYVP